MQRPGWQFALIVLVAAVALFTNLGGPRLWDRDEPRNAGCAAEMLARNDWVVPTFNQELRDAKPVLLYWLIMSAYSVFGVTEFAARFWSAALGFGTVLATYAIANRLFNRQVALLAAIILSTSTMFEVASRAATPDAPLIFCGTMALMIYVLGTFRPRDTAVEWTAPEPRVPGRYFPTNYLAVAAMYAAMGVGILAKGPVGLVLPTAVIGMFVLIQSLPARAESARPPSRRAGITSTLRACGRPFAPAHFLRTCWQMRLVTATVIGLAIAAPWYVLVGIQTDGAFLRGFFLDEHIGRATRAMEPHSGGPLFYPVAVAVGFFPWSVFMLPIFMGAIRRICDADPWRTGYLLATCWVGVYVGLFSLAATKLPSYVTPCYPALAMLGACFVYHLLRGTTVVSERWLRAALAILGLVGVLVMIGLPVAATYFLPGEQLLGAAGLIPLIGAIVCYAFLQRGMRKQMVISFTTMALLMAVSIFGLGLPSIDRHRHSFALLESIQKNRPDAKIGEFGGVEPSLVFYAGQRIEPLVIDRPTAERQQARLTLRNFSAPPPRSTIVEFLQQNLNGVLLTSRRNYHLMADKLPTDVEILGEVPRFLKRGDTLVLLGRPGDTPRMADDNSGSIKR